MKKNPDTEMPISISTKQKILLLLLIVSFLVPLSYAIYTGHIWEDYYITYRFSRNLVEGRGLVHTEGERVHGFTSPLGVLLPAFTYFVTGSDKGALWLFRLLFAIPAFTGAVYMLFKSSEKIFGEYPSVVYLCPLLLIFDAKSVMFSVNGMETAFMLFFLAWLLKIAICEEWNWKKIGICWGALLWTRPDSSVYITGFVISSLLFLPLLRKSQVGLFLKSALLCAAIYLPWFIFAWTYYGSPVPHTIIAKRALLAASDFSLIEEISSALLLLREIPVIIFYPVYPQFGDWPLAVFIFASVCGYLAIFAGFAPVGAEFKGKIRFLSFYFMLLCLYFALIRLPYPWYFPPAALPAFIVICAAAIAIRRRLALRNSFIIVFSLVILSCFLVLFFLETERMKTQQKIVEEGNRKLIGLWLKENTEESDRIFLECLGYIGYFSERKILDFPGLVSPEVVKAAAGKKNGFAAAVEALAPEWIVAREFEVRALLKSDFFRKHYNPIAEFDVRDKIAEQKHLYGVDYLYYDSCFLIFQKK